MRRTARHWRARGLRTWDGGLSLGCALHVGSRRQSTHCASSRSRRAAARCRTRIKPAGRTCRSGWHAHAKVLANARHWPLQSEPATCSKRLPWYEVHSTVLCSLRTDAGLSRRKGGEISPKSRGGTHLRVARVAGGARHAQGQLRTAVLAARGVAVRRRRRLGRAADGSTRHFTSTPRCIRRMRPCTSSQMYADRAGRVGQDSRVGKEHRASQWPCSPPTSACACTRIGSARRTQRRGPRSTAMPARLHA